MARQACLAWSVGRASGNGQQIRWQTGLAGVQQELGNLLRFGNADALFFINDQRVIVFAILMQEQQRALAVSLHHDIACQLARRRVAGYGIAHPAEETAPATGLSKVST